MHVSPSVKKRCAKCVIVRRKLVNRVICKENPNHKTRGGKRQRTKAG